MTQPSCARGAALVVAVLALALVSAVALSLAVVIQTDIRIAAAFGGSRDALYAADGAIEIAAAELLDADWNTVLAGGVVSGFVDGPAAGPRPLSDGRTVNLTDRTSQANAEVRPWGANNPRWQLFAFGPMGPRAYVIAWAGDDPAENDGDPARDGADASNPGSGILTVRAEAFAAGGARRVLEATIRRTLLPSGDPQVQVVSWQEIRP